MSDYKGVSFKIELSVLLLRASERTCISEIQCVHWVFEESEGLWGREWLHSARKESSMRLAMCFCELLLMRMKNGKLLIHQNGVHTFANNILNQ